MESTAPNRRQQIAALLKRYWGFDTFRPVQEQVILSVLAGRDTLALMPTGGGKSLTYQIPGLASDANTKSSGSEPPDIMVLMPTAPPS